jgi:hypothetical protein
MANKDINIKEKIKEEFLRCASDPVYFMKKYYLIQHPQKGRQIFNLYPFQELTLKLFQKNSNCIINKSRQLGISTLVSAYSLWLMIFQRDKNVLVIATKQDTAKNMVTKVRFAYDNLPNWLKVGATATSNNQLSLRLSNGSQIKAASSAGDAGRSEAVSLLIIDEAAFIDNIDTIYTAAKLTLATGGGCIALSTPNGHGNWFHKTYSAAQKRENDFLPICLPWHVHPERDETWRKQQDVDLGVRNAAQECDGEFNSSGATVVLPDILEWYSKNLIVDPINMEGYDRSRWIWEYPDPMKHYVIVADIARGDGSDYSTYQVIDVDTITQVAEYKSQIDTRLFANELISIANSYNQALLVIDNVGVGWDVVQSVVESGYPNIHYSYKSETTGDFETYLSAQNGRSTMVPGFTTSQRNRPSIIEKMRDCIENKVATIKSIRLLEELRVFIWKNGKPQASPNYNDDLVMSFAVAMYLRETSLRFKRASESLTSLALNNYSKEPSGHAVYDSKSYYQSSPWSMRIDTPTGNENVDLTWLLQ